MRNGREGYGGSSSSGASILENEDIRGMLISCIGVLLGIGVYSDLGGILSDFSQMILYNLFGIGSYILPCYIIFYGLICILPSGGKPKVHTLLGLTICVSAITLFVSVMNLQRIGLGYFDETLRLVLNSGETGMHGGLIGFLFSFGLTKLIGFTGTYIVYLCFVVVGIRLMAKMSFSDVVERTINVVNGASKGRANDMIVDEIYSDESSVRPRTNRRQTGRTDRLDTRQQICNNRTQTSQVGFGGRGNSREMAFSGTNGNYKEENNDDDYSSATRRMPIITNEENECTSNTEKNPNYIDSYIKPKENDGLENNINNINKTNNTSKPKERVKTSNFSTENMKLNYCYKEPSIELLDKNPTSIVGAKDKKELFDRATTLEDTLLSFGVEAKVTQVTVGPSVTRFELQPKAGVKVAKIVNLQDDIALGLSAQSVRVEAPVPGKPVVGIEIPNKKQTPVFLRDIIESIEFSNANDNLSFALGKNISGKSTVGDLAKMPHLLIAGATGAGKSVCINAFIMSILYKYTPDMVKLLLIDPKVVELSGYNGIPHLLCPVVTDAEKATNSLEWAVEEMDKRYNLLSKKGVKNINSYNKLMDKGMIDKKMPRIVIIVDELADLMMVSQSSVEDYICRLAQKARAAGIHLIIATQRPSVDIITGVIKANIPSRIAFAVSSGIDSRTILDQVGAEKLLGKGDMLYLPIGENKPIRVQGAYVSEEEVENVISFIKKGDLKISYDEEIVDYIENGGENKNDSTEGRDELIDMAIKTVREYDQASTSLIQRKLKIGFNRATLIMEELEEMGVISEKDGNKPRQVILK